MKYVMLESVSGCVHPVLFPPEFSHQGVADRLSDLLPDGLKPISGGRIHLSETHRILSVDPRSGLPARRGDLAAILELLDQVLHSPRRPNRQFIPAVPGHADVQALLTEVQKTCLDIPDANENLSLRLDKDTGLLCLVWARKEYRAKAIGRANVSQAQCVSDATGLVLEPNEPD